MKTNTYMLVNQDNANILPLGREALKGRLDRSIIRLVVHHKEVLLRVWGSRNVLFWFESAH